MKKLWSRVLTAFDDLSERERVLVSIVGVLAVVLVIYFGVIQSSLGLRSDARQRLTQAEQQLTAMSRLRNEFDDVNERLTSVEQRIQSSTRGNLRTTLESLALASQVTVDSMEPQATPSDDRYRETKVEVALKEVTLQQTVSYLHEIESSEEVLSVKSLRMRTRKDRPDFLDVTFTVSTFEPI
jgi:type II secretory pathway component PulM